MVYLTIYAVKAFLPIFIISQEGGTVFQAGLFFFIQELIHIAFRLVGGKLADRNHTLLAIVIGMFLIALGLSLLNILPQNLLLLSAGLFGAGQGFIFPSSVAMLSRKANKIHIGAAMGLYGALRKFR
jgi:MFS family permease